MKKPTQPYPLPGPPRRGTERRILSMKVIVLLGAAVLACTVTPLPVWSQSNVPAPAADSVQERLKAVEESLGFIEQKLAKEINDLVWFRRLDDIAEVDKVRYTPTLRAATLSIGLISGWRRNRARKSIASWRNI